MGRAPASIVARAGDRALQSALPALRVIDRVAAWLDRGWLACVAAALVLVPLSRLLPAPRAALVATLLLAGAAATASLLAAAHALHAGRHARVAARALVAGLALRALFAAALTLHGGLPDEYGYYDVLARESAARWTDGVPSLLALHPVTAGRWTYFYLLTAAYTALGADVLVGRLVGAVVGLASALLAGEVARPIAGDRAAAVAVVLLALHPEHALWSVTLSRDGVATLLVLLALAAVVRREGRLLHRGTIGVLGAVALLALNTTPAAVALAAALSLAGFVAELRRSASSGVARVRAATIALGTAAAAAGGWALLGSWFSLRRIALARSGAAAGDLAELAGLGRLTADFLPGHELTGPLDVALLLPAGASFVLFAPFPWDAVHVDRAVYGALALPGVAVTILGVVGLARAARARAAALPVALFALFSLSILALLEGNSGVVVRHRLPLTACLVVGAATLGGGPRRREPPLPPTGGGAGARAV